jgi:hypothetical protein
MRRYERESIVDNHTTNRVPVETINAHKSNDSIDTGQKLLKKAERQAANNEKGIHPRERKKAFRRGNKKLGFVSVLFLLLLLLD